MNIATTNFQDALETLGITDYRDRILNSNSHGELFHVQQYIMLAELFKTDNYRFKKWFKDTVDFAENNWQRPESVFQHIIAILKTTQ